MRATPTLKAYDEARTQASEAIRGLLEGIVLEPDEQQLRILVKGNLASMLRFAPKCETLQPPESTIGAFEILVAGARYQRYRTLICMAA